MDDYSPNGLYKLLIDALKEYNISFENMLGFPVDNCSAKLKKDNFLKSILETIFSGRKVIVSYCLHFHIKL